MIYLIADKRSGVREVSEADFYNNLILSEDDFCDRIFDLRIGERIAAAFTEL